MHKLSRHRPAAAAPFHWKLSIGGIAAIVAAGAIACTEDVPTAPKATDPTQPTTSARPSDPSRAIAILQCRGNLPNLEVNCGGLAGRTRGPGPNISDDIILGGQNVFVKLTSSNVAYNAGTGRFTFDVTVQNLIEQALGTTDGTTLDPDGVRVFFISGPTVTSGSGIASTFPDGFGTFTAPGQAYFQYNEVLSQNETSPPKQWMLIMPPTVITFEFVVLVWAEVQFPDGYVSITPGPSPLYPGTRQLTGVVKNANGTLASNPDPIVWGTSDPNVATVDGAGLVSGIKAGNVTITATSGTRIGTSTFPVTPAMRTWTGDVSTEWTNPGNWSSSPSVAYPASTDSILIPTGRPNYPVLTLEVQADSTTIQDGARIDLAAFTYTGIGGVFATGSGNITGTGGVLILAGTNHTVGLPGTPITAATILVTGTYSLSGDVLSRGPIVVNAGTIEVAGFTLGVDAN